MRYGFVLPFGDARTVAESAREAEVAGWDGFFVWEPVWGTDAWVSLTAAAMRTERIRLGTMLTALSRRRPWKLASETATLDQLSNGRVILAVGLGAVDSGFEAFGEVTDRKTRAELLDEGLDVLTGLWRGLPFEYEGKHYKIHANDKTVHAPGKPLPVQKPRIPIWVVGAWFREKSMQRVLKYDGLLPNAMTARGKHRRLTPKDVRAMKAWIKQNRTATTPFDLVVEEHTPGDEPARARRIAHKWQDAGATWLLEADWTAKEADAVLTRIKQGPPRGGK